MIDISNFGTTLRTERERQGIALEAAAEATKIRKLYIKALEEENFDVLPARVYAIGFVASYAQFLKLDPDTMVSQFKSLAYPGQAAPETEFAGKKHKRSIQLPVGNIIAAALFLLIVFWTGSLISDYLARQGTEQPPASQEPAEVQNTPAPTAVPERLVLAIEARQKCWLQVKADGEDQFTGFINTGEKKSFAATSSIVVKAGNAGGIDLYLNNQPVAPLGSLGQVVEKQFDISSIVEE